MPKKEFGLDGILIANCFDLRNVPMYDVWVIDFVANEKRLFRSELGWKKANRLVKRKNKKDRFSLFVVVPIGFCLG
jgi:hypothetical protein